MEEEDTKNTRKTEEEHSNHKDTMTHALDPHIHRGKIKIQGATKVRYTVKFFPIRKELRS